MTPDVLKVIVDEVFAVLLVSTASKPLLHIFVLSIQAIADGLLPQMAANLKAKGVSASVPIR